VAIVERGSLAAVGGPAAHTDHVAGATVPGLTIGRGGGQGHEYSEVATKWQRKAPRTNVPAKGEMTPRGHGSSM